MSLTAYKATSLGMTALKRLLGLKLRVSGTENIDNRTTLFVANHFTRVETFLIPHVIYEYAGRQVRSLGTHSVFKGLFGRYFEALGGMSTRHPRRNRTIIKELMAGDSDWIIYPEGGLIKNKQLVHRGSGAAEAHAPGARRPAPHGGRHARPQGPDVQAALPGGVRRG
ncbi:MAG: 1-acyl-sn-glycerol-3-phosphate acyltransferase [Planctomycetota bacterium]|jgi:1-acyl-sn-glycerol-3-phosphate acyltransferase